MSKTKNPQHRELEVKIDAMGVDAAKFLDWCFASDPSRYVHLTSPDTYFTQGSNVLRHRYGGKTAGELTVKRRTSENSTVDRVEVDLRFDPATTHQDVRRFLAATGWEPAFDVVKDCHIFWFEDRKPAVEVVLYDARCIRPDGTETEARRFIEIEIHKADSGHPKALTTLKDWEKQVRLFFKVGETQSLSLYEIYSGQRYGLDK